MPIITLTTDFGLRDSFVASMKGVILGINPDVHLVDISHDIAPHDLEEAAFTVDASYRYFPKGTVHVVVVDPGVGSGRRPILVATDRYSFIGPDNGVFSLVFQQAERLKVHQITAERYFLPNPGPTFHGRDIFAPAAAWLTKGVSPGDFGAELEVETGSGGVDVNLGNLSGVKTERGYFRGVVGNGNGEVTIETGSGGVKITRG